MRILRYSPQALALAIAALSHAQPVKKHAGVNAQQGS
jgi:hypothetical protein